MARDTRRKPYKFTARKRTEYLELLRGGSRRGTAAHAVGVTRQTVSAYKKRDLEFAALADDAETDANEEVEDALFMAATSGNVTAIQVWLYNRWPDRWRDARNLKVEIYDWRKEAQEKGLDPAIVFEQYVQEAAAALATGAGATEGRSVADGDATSGDG